MTDQLFGIAPVPLKAHVWPDPNAPYTAYPAP